MQVNQRNWQELIKPMKLEVISGRDRRRVGTVVAEPLERGFGMTLGNALRRILLSSLQGAAVTSAHIDGVLHEFSSIAGVREDVTDIILNIKEIGILMHVEGPKRLTLRKEGPGVVTAGDIQETADIKILNPNQPICTLDEGAEVRMEFTVNTGKGYVPADRNKQPGQAIGTIAIDALFSVLWSGWSGIDASIAGNSFNVSAISGMIRAVVDAADANGIFPGLHTANGESSARAVEEWARVNGFVAASSAPLASAQRNVAEVH